MKVVSEHETELSIQILELLSVLLDLGFNLLAHIIKLVPLLDRLLYSSLCFVLFLFDPCQLSLQLIKVIALPIELLTVALLLLLYSLHLGK